MRLMLAVLALLVVLRVPAQTCTNNAFQDPSFEAGNPSVAWTVGSTAGNEVLQESALAVDGDFIASFGGQMGTPDFTTLSQSVTLPAGATVTLRFLVMHPQRSGNTADRLELVIDDAPEVFFPEGQNNDNTYRSFTRDLSELADGEAHTIALRSITTGNPGAARWVVDGMCLSVVTTAGEGEGEGEEEGEGEGNDEACPLDSIEITEPRAGATYYIGSDAGAIDIPVQAEVDCPSETQSVNFFVKRGSDGTRVSIAQDSTSPYEAVLQDVLPSGTRQTFEFSADAVAVDTQDTFSDAASITLAAPGSGEDADGNGLPDEPFVVLDNPGDRWITSGVFAGTAARLISAALVMYGDDTDSGNAAASITLTPPGGTTQSVEINVPAGLVQTDEVGIFIAQTALDLDSLVGTAESESFSREPTGAFEQDGVYVAVSLVVTDDAGDTFSQVPASRLSGKPITVALSGVPLDEGEEYSLALHPAKLESVNSSLQLLHATGAWRALAVQSVDLADNRFTGELTSFGVLAPYRLVDETSVCNGGECPPALLWIELLLLLAFGILGLADGGVGGGDGPCFIATAAYGTPLAAQIDVLRHLRDDTLLNSTLGTAFVDTYYRVSPAVADAVAASPILAAMVRLLLLPILVLTQVYLAHPAACTALLVLIVVRRAHRRFRRA